MNPNTETLELSTTSEFKRQLEEAAARHNLSLPAYLMYLFERQSGRVDPNLLDRMVREVYGKYGNVMRRLAK